MALAATGYNLVHAQVAPKTASPVFKDIPYATSADFSVDQDNEVFLADGGARVTAYGSREGSGSIAFGSADLEMMATLSGDTFSTDGTTPSIIDRLEIGGTSSPPSVILALWVPNVDGNSDSAGLRITLPNAKVAVPSTTFEQESWTEFEADMSFVGNENDVMMIYESLETAPTFTGGVIPVALTATP